MKPMIGIFVSVILAGIVVCVMEFVHHFREVHQWKEWQKRPRKNREGFDE